MEALLQQEVHARAQVDVLTRRFMAEPEGPLNGSVYPALRYEPAKLCDTMVIDVVPPDTPVGGMKPVKVYVILLV